jgi:predicted membrane metal-binding protein
MALPTRSARARLLWAALAIVLLLATSIATMLYGANLAVLFIDAMNVFLGFVAGFADVIQVVFAAVGPALLIILAIGAFVDLVLATVYLAVSRRRAREA